MNKALLKNIEAWFHSHQEEMLSTLLEFVSVPSIAQYDDPDYVYGKPCHDIMNLWQRTAQKMGFTTLRFEDHVAVACTEEYPIEESIGLWSHLDVVPAGGGWVFEPFQPVIREGYVIGRGADDNKSAVVGTLYLLRCLRELDVPMKHAVQLFVGCDEERGSFGVEWYAQNQPCPLFSIVPDCGFPVCYGEKGIINATFRSNRSLSADVISLEGGSASNVIPDTAVAILRATPERINNFKALPNVVDCIIEGETIRLIAHGTSGHAGFPVGHINAIRVLTDVLLNYGLLRTEDADIVSFLHRVNSDCYGTELGIAMEDDESGRLTCAGTILRTKNGVPALSVNIRYCVTANGEKIHLQLERCSEKSEFSLDTFVDSPPNLYPKAHPVVDALTSVYSEITKNDVQPYTMSGGTYARHLPNALGFGIGGLHKQQCPFIPAGHGGAHLPDEVLHIDSWMNALVILTMGVLEADQIL